MTHMLVWHPASEIPPDHLQSSPMKTVRLLLSCAEYPLPQSGIFPRSHQEWWFLTPWGQRLAKPDFWAVYPPKPASIVRTPEVEKGLIDDL